MYKCKCRVKALEPTEFESDNAQLVKELQKYLTQDDDDVDKHSMCTQRQKIKQRSDKFKKTKRKRNGAHFVKCRKYYKYRTMTRKNEFNYLQRYGKLWQQYIVDNWAKVDDNDLNYLKNNQATIRRAHASGLEAAIDNDDVASIGIPTILPRSHVGSPRWFHDKFQDAMSIIQAYKKPDLFITFTCNPKWKEITDNLFENQTAYDRPALVARVFNLKTNKP